MEEIVPHTVKMLLEQGHEVLRPLYKALYNSNIGKRIAVQTFVENRDIYHPICSKMVARDLELED